MMRKRSWSTLTTLQTTALGVVVVLLSGLFGSAQSAQAATYSIVENSDGRISYVGPWTTVISGYESGGTYARLDAPGSVELTFDGVGIRWTARVNNYAGMANVVVDGQHIETIDMYSATTAYRQVVFDSGPLEAGSHTLRIEWAGTKNSASTGRNIFLDSFVIESGSDGTPIAEVSGRYEQDASTVLLGPTAWQTVSSGYSSGGSYAVSRGPGSVANFIFMGSSFSLTSRTANYFGIAAVFVDGVRLASIDLFSPTVTYSTEIYRSPNFAYGEHAVRVEYSGGKNQSSTGREINLDAITVFDDRAPDSMLAPTVSSGRLGLDVTWIASSAPDVVGYRVYRAYLDSGYRLVAKLEADARAFRDIGLLDSAWYSYRTSAVDSSGNESIARSATAKKTLAQPSGEFGRVSRCPAPTITVRNSADLKSALAQVTAGDVIMLEAGDYVGPFTLDRSGTARQPIWLCGTPGASLATGGISQGEALTLSSVSNVNVAGFSISNAKKAVMVVSSTNVSVADLTIDLIGEEAIHLRSGTSASFVTSNVIRSTGLSNAEYGEGVYVGTDPSNWCLFSSCAPDQSDGNVIAGNDIAGTTAEPIELKPGSSGGLIERNVLDGASVDQRFANALVAVGGSDYLIRTNVGTTSPQHAYRAYPSSTAPGWGKGNAFAKNSATLTSQDSFAIWIAKDLGGWVSCDNTREGGFGLSNVPCQD